VSLIDEAVEAVATGIASAVMVLDLELIVLGGGLVEKLGDPFVSRVDEAVRARLFPGSDTTVVAAALGDHAGVIGAARLAESD
jgi:glucokinase